MDPIPFRITTNNHRTFQVNQVSYYSDSCDLFLFKWSREDIKMNKLKYLFLNEGRVEKSQQVFSVSHPMGFDYSFSLGNVSSLREFNRYGSIVQTTTPISSGSSGSPLLSRQGEVIGVNTFSYIDGQNLNFSIRLNKSTIERLIISEGQSLPDLLFDLSHSLEIGEQVWMNTNLSVNHFRNGDIIAQEKTSKEWVLACKEGRPVWAFPKAIEQENLAFLEDIEDVASASNTDYGKLYNFHAVFNERGLPPEGWEIPTVYDWDKLINQIGGWKYQSTKSMKNSTEWEYFEIQSNSFKTERDNTNESGLSILPSGNLTSEGLTDGIGRHRIFWSLTDCINTNFQYGIGFNSLTFIYDINTNKFAKSPQIALDSIYKMRGAPVRCIRKR